MPQVNKKIALLGTVLSCALCGQAWAQSSVRVGGVVDTFVGSMKNAGDSDRTAVVGSGGMTTSYVGFEGSEDLGGGLKAQFALNTFLRGDIGAQGRFNGDTMWARDANVGLAGGFGSVTLGRIISPSFLPTILFNPFGDSFTFSPLVLHTYISGSAGFSNAIAGDSGWSNQVRYTTPSFGGLTANLHYQLGETAGDTGRNNIGANVLYFGGPFSATAYYQRVEVTNPTPGAVGTPVQSFGGLNALNQKAWMVGGAYDFSFAKLFLTYGQTSHDVSIKDKIASVGVSIPAGPGKVMADYAQTRREIPGTDSKRETATVGYDYVMSKRTDLYANLMYDRLTGFNNGTSFGVGIRHRF